MQLITAEVPESPARVDPPTRPPFTVGVVQTRWHADPDAHRAVLLDGIHVAAEAGAQVVFLFELTLSRYPADTRPQGSAAADAEDLETGPTYAFAASAAAECGIAIHASLYERAVGPDGLGYNTAILVGPDGTLLGRTRKLHIPVTAGYYEDHYFRPGPAAPNPYPAVNIPGVRNGQTAARVGLPTCWDQWFAEVARAYALSGAEIIAYPTAIGSEPDHHSRPVRTNPGRRATTGGRRVGRATGPRPTSRLAAAVPLSRNPPPGHLPNTHRAARRPEGIRMTVSSRRGSRLWRSA